MIFSIPFLLLGLFAAPQAQAQMPCAANATLPCLCPAGTQYAESGTFLIAGVGSSPLKASVGDFFNTTWLKRPLISTEGVNNIPSAKRTTRVTTKVGVYDITETLTSFQAAPDGSFKLLYEQTTPVKFKNGKGSFAGWWYNLQGENAFPYQSPMRWSLFACQTGHPINFASFATARLEELIETFKVQGVYNGDTLGPLSFQRF